MCYWVYTVSPRASLGNFYAALVMSPRSQRCQRFNVLHLVFHISAHCASSYSVYQHSALPQVLPVCQMLPADLNYYGACSYTAWLGSLLFCYNRQVPLTTGMCLCLCLAVNVCCELTMCFKVKSVGTSCFAKFLLTRTGEKVGRWGHQC